MARVSGGSRSARTHDSLAVVACGLRVKTRGKAFTPTGRQNSGVSRWAHVTYLWLSHPLDDLGRNREQVTPCPEVLTIERTKRVKSNSRRRPRAGILENPRRLAHARCGRRLLPVAGGNRRRPPDAAL